jgi:hypothetical protein
MMVEIGIDSLNKELLDDLKQNFIKFFEKSGHTQCAKILSKFDYNDLIKLLNLGFGEEHLFESLQGIVKLDVSPDLNTFNWNEIQMRLQHLKSGR